MQTVENALLSAVEAHEKGDLSSAEQLYLAILNVIPGHPDANHNLGVLLSSQNKLLQAQDYFREALRGYPKVPQFWESYVECLVNACFIKDAKFALEEARSNGLSMEIYTKLKQKLSLVRKSLGLPKHKLRRLIELFQAGELNEAEHEGLILVKNWPGLQQAWKILGAVYKQTHRLHESLDAFQTAARLDKSDPEAINNIGVVLLEQRQFEAAERFFRKAVSLSPKYAEANFNLGVVLEKLGRFLDSEASYRSSLAIMPDNAAVHLNLGNVLHQLGKLEEASQCFYGALAIKPDNPDAHNNLGVMLQQLGRLEESEACYFKALTLDNNFARAYNNLSVVFLEQGRLDRAIGYC